MSLTTLARPVALAAALSLVSLASAQERYNLELLANVPWNVDGSGARIENGNDIWGYVDSAGTEYAVIGSTIAAYVFSLEDPSEPRLRATIPGATSTWRDFKSYGNYIYHTTDAHRNGETPDGLTVIDMTHAPDSITYSRYYPTYESNGAVGTLEDAHNLYITAEGYLILAGANVGRGEPQFFDLNQDPLEPPHVGSSRAVYAHDVFAERGRLYSSDIFAGEMTVHDYTDTAAIDALGSVITTTRFTHNAWPTDDDAAAFTTDERGGAFVDAYDVRDAEDPRLLDAFRPDDTYAGGSIPHNTHVRGSHLITSWYRDGVVVTDASRPHNMVEVGRYDTYPGGGGGFDGCWGAYPYLPSGLVLASDIQSGLFVFRPNYERGCYYEGVVVDSVTRQPIAGASIDFAGRLAQATVTDAGGDFATGIYEEGIYPVRVAADDYGDWRGFATMRRGVVNYDTIELVRRIEANITVEVRSAETGELIPGGQSLVLYQGAEGGVGRYDILGGAWGYQTTLRRNVLVDGGASVTIAVELPRGYYDDFVFDFGWELTEQAQTGNWTRDIPVGTFSNGTPVQVGGDLPDDFGAEAYVTGNDGTGVGDDDVDNGVTTLTSPAFDLRDSPSAQVEFYYSFYNGGGSGTPNDELVVSLSNGATTVELLRVEDTAPGWNKFRSGAVSDLLAVTGDMQLVVSTSDFAGSGHLVEAALDGFSVTTVERPALEIDPALGCAPLRVELRGRDDDLPANTTWYLPGASTENFTAAEVSATYNSPGVYDVFVTVDDGSGAPASFVYSNAVEVQPVTVADFRVQVIRDTAFFYNLSQAGPQASWDFGDGTSSTDPFVAHVYPDTGRYTATLTVTGPCNTATATQTVVITQLGVSAPPAVPQAETWSVVTNPTRDRLTLRNPGAARELSLLDGTGRHLRTLRVAGGGLTEVPVAALPEGLYFLTEADAGRVERVVVAR